MASTGKLRSMDSPEKESPKKTRGITKTPARPQEGNRPFLTKGSSNKPRGMKGC